MQHNMGLLRGSDPGEEHPMHGSFGNGAFSGCARLWAFLQLSVTVVQITVTALRPKGSGSGLSFAASRRLWCSLHPLAGGVGHSRATPSRFT